MHTKRFKIRNKNDIEQFRKYVYRRFMKAYYHRSPLIRRVSDITGLSFVQIWKKMMPHARQNVKITFEDAVLIDYALDLLKVK